MTQPYWKYLQSEHWISFRDAVLRERQSCELCDTYAASNVHHLTYERRGSELPSDVLALCRPCHAGLHNKWGEVIGLGGDALVAHVIYYQREWSHHGCVIQERIQPNGLPKKIHTPECSHGQ